MITAATITADRMMITRCLSIESLPKLAPRLNVSLQKICVFEKNSLQAHEVGCHTHAGVRGSYGRLRIAHAHAVRIIEEEHITNETAMIIL